MSVYDEVNVSVFNGRTLFNEIKKLIDTHMMTGSIPKVLSMNQKDYDKLAATVKDYVTFNTEYSPDAEVFGVRIRIDNRLEDGVMYVTDENFFEGERVNE